MPASGHLYPVGKLVGVRVGVVEEAALLDHQSARCLRDPACVPAHRPLPAGPLDRLDRVSHVGALVLLGHVQIVNPAPAVARHFPACLDHRSRGGRVTLERLAHRVDGERQAVGLEDAVNAPEARATAVLEHRLGVEVAPAGRRRRAHDFVQERLRLGIALQRRPLAALLVVEDEAERQPGAARPLRVGRMPRSRPGRAWSSPPACDGLDLDEHVGSNPAWTLVRAGIGLREELAVDAVVAVEVAKISEERVHLQHVVQRAPGRSEAGAYVLERLSSAPRCHPRRALRRRRAPPAPPCRRDRR